VAMVYADKKTKQAKVEVGGDERRRGMALFVGGAHLETLPFPGIEAAWRYFSSGD